MKSLTITAGLAVGCLGSAYAQQAPLRGTILDAQTQQALPGATTVTSNQYGTTYHAAAPRTYTLGVGYTFAGKVKE